MHFTEKVVNGNRYRIAAQAVWDAAAGQSYSRQLGPAEMPVSVKLAQLRTVGRRPIGDVGALVWVAGE
jgi:hypothetical protein